MKQKYIRADSDWDKFPNLESTTSFDVNVFKYYCPIDFMIADIGCGYGRICGVLENHGYKNIIGVDSSSVLLERAIDNLEHTCLVAANGLSIPIREGSVDCAISFGLINCLTKYDQLTRYAAELGKIVRPDGYLFINEFTRNNSPYFDDKYNKWKDKFGGNRVFKSNSGIMFRHYSIVEILSVFDPYFELIACNKQNYLSLNHKRTVCGYSIVLKKLSYQSSFRQGPGDELIGR